MEKKMSDASSTVPVPEIEEALGEQRDVAAKNAEVPEMALKVSVVKGAWLRYYPHALGIALGTGFDEFNALCGVNGLAKEYDAVIEILAVDADTPGTGQFRAFVSALKESFNAIFIWEVWNPTLEAVLLRYDFRPVTRQEEDGEMLAGFKWEVPSAEQEGSDK